MKSIKEVTFGLPLFVYLVLVTKDKLLSNFVRLVLISFA